MKLLGLRTIIYPSLDIEADKNWWIEVTGVQPHFDQPFYVGFNIGGYELGLQPAKTLAGGPKTYFGVENVSQAVAHFVKSGCTIVDRPLDVGEGIVVATVKRPNGQLVSFIKNPFFKIQEP